MEKYRPIPVQEVQNSPIEAPLTREQYDETWNQDRIQQHMDNVQMLHGVWWHDTFWWYGQPQRGKSQ